MLNNTWTRWIVGVYQRLPNCKKYKKPIVLVAWSVVCVIAGGLVVFVSTGQQEPLNFPPACNNSKVILQLTTPTPLPQTTPTPSTPLPQTTPTPSTPLPQTTSTTLPQTIPTPTPLWNNSDPELNIKSSEMKTAIENQLKRQQKQLQEVEDVCRPLLMAVAVTSMLNTKDNLLDLYLITRYVALYRCPCCKDEDSSSEERTEGLLCLGKGVCRPHIMNDSNNSYNIQDTTTIYISAKSAEGKKVVYTRTVKQHSSCECHSCDD